MCVYSADGGAKIPLDEEAILMLFLGKCVCVCFGMLGFFFFLCVC